MKKGREFHAEPFKASHTKKMTLCRLRKDEKVQSIPIFEIILLKNGRHTRKFLGFKYIFHL